MYDNLLVGLDDKAVILTPTRRLARHLHRHYASRQMTANQQAWVSPQIVALSDYFLSAWQDVLLHAVPNEPRPYCITAWQLEKIWESIIVASDYNHALLQTYDTAKTAVQAWQHCQLWQIKPEDFAAHQRVDVNAYQLWAQRYQQIVKKRWIDESQLAGNLSQYFLEWQLPEQITLVNFEEVVPAHLALIEKMQHHGVVVSQYQSMVDGPTEQQAYSNQSHEYAAAAQYAQQVLSENDSNSIAIVVPDLANTRDEVQRVFTETLCPQTLLGDSSKPPFTISSGESLLSITVIQVAIDLLSTVVDKVSIETCSQMIRSPYLRAGQRAQLPRHQLEQYLLEQNTQHFGLISLIKAMQSWQASIDSDYQEPLIVILESLYAQSQSWQVQQPLANWADCFADCLLQFGWPGEQAVDSREYQAIAQWHAIIDEFARGYCVDQPVSAISALNLLKEMTRNHLFQIEAKDERCQILGALEAAGLEFSHIWVTGLSDDIWPGKPSPNPFLPHELQSAHQMPHADAARELAFAQELTARFRDCAEQTIFSYPEFDDDKPLLASPLLKEIPIGHSLSQAPSLLVQMEAQSRPALEHFIDDQGGVYASKKLPQAVRRLNAQAACPFQAFSKSRFFAESMPKSQIGIPPLMKGILIHDVMQVLWTKWGSQAAMLSLSEEALSAQVESVFTDIQLQHQDKLASISQLQLAVERTRVVQLVVDWLALEKTREPFRVIALEQNLRIHIAGLEILLRVDRIDQDEHGNIIVIDYKTGLKNINEWAGTRPDDVQLPLYACYYDNVSAIAFAQMVTNACDYKGLADNPELLPKIALIAKQEKIFEADTMAALKQVWQQHIHHLVQDYQQGIANVTPKKPVLTCQRCDLQALCRINAQMDEEECV